MMHEVNMTCQIDAHLGTKTDKIEESMALGLWFVWTIRAEYKKGTIHRRTQSLLCMLVKMYMQ